MTKSTAKATDKSPPRMTKQEQIASLLLRDEGATLDQMITGWLRHTTRAALTGPLDRPGTGKQAPVHVIEPIIRCVEHEAAGDADRDPDRAPIELDYKSLRNHDDFAPSAQQSPGRGSRIQTAAVRLIE